MTARGLWLRVLGSVGGAVAVFALLDVPAPTNSGVAAVPALAIGLGCGLALFIALARQLPPRPPLQARGRSLTRLALIVVLAGVEEILWRWLVLGALATTVAWPIALTVSTLAFAATHRLGRRTHLATGAMFGLVYLATGRLLACVAAHAAYNLTLAETLAQTRLRVEPA